MGTGTSPPPTVTDPEAELSLRRQLSRLQRQLADAQRELANKDDELATAVEKRLEIQAAYDVLIEEQRQTRKLVDEAIADRRRTGGIEQRLQQATAAADELRHQLERERAERAALATQLDEAQAAFEKARTAWREESATIDEQHIAQIAQLEQQKKTAVEAAEQAMKTATERQFQAHEAELEALRAAHERALSALRGEVEPQVAQARNLSAEIERLKSEIAAQAAEHRTLLSERVELDKWEMQQQAESHAADIAALQRAHSAEVTRLNEEVNAANQAGQLIERNAALREQLWEQTVQGLRDSQKKLQQELAEARERAAQAEASKWSIDTRLVSTQQAHEKAAEEIRELREKLDIAQAESRRDALDRQRFAAYLEEGLAMLGALPPKLPAAEPHEDDDLSIATAHTEPSEHERPTRSYAVTPADLEDDEDESEIELQTPVRKGSAPNDRPRRPSDSPHVVSTDSPGHDDEADPLPEPTRP
jgi:chromosome segregation ATPase